MRARLLAPTACLGLASCLAPPACSAGSDEVDATTLAAVDEAVMHTALERSGWTPDVACGARSEEPYPQQTCGGQKGDLYVQVAVGHHPTTAAADEARVPPGDPRDELFPVYVAGTRTLLVAATNDAVGARLADAVQATAVARDAGWLRSFLEAQQATDLACTDETPEGRHLSHCRATLDGARVNIVATWPLAEAGSAEDQRMGERGMYFLTRDGVEVNLTAYAPAAGREAAQAILALAREQAASAP